MWESEVWSNWADCSLAILDELGMRVAVTDVHFETVKKAIDLREGRPAAFIANLSLDNIAGIYDDRIASRLAAGTVFKLDGPDRRVEPTGTRREMVER